MLKLQDIAKRYMAQGFNVIPILPEQKKPAQKWMEFNDRKAEPLELQTWFAGKQSNIGIVTGEISKVVVVDIDKPELFNEFVKEYPTHRIQRTASGGYHLLYRYSGKDIGNSVSRLSNGIDVRGNHGYIVTYPSVIRLANGGLGEYHWQEEGELLPLPVPLHDLIIKELGAYKVELAAGTDGKDLWTDILNNGFTPGKHNEQVKDLARFFYRMHMPEDVIITTLELLNLQDATPLPQNELISTIKSGINYEKTRLNLQAAGLEVPPEHKAKYVKAFDLMIEYDGHEEEWLIDSWLPRNSLMMVVAPPENYKTWIALEMAVQVALGDKATNFLGGTWRGPKKPEPVLIVQQEDQEAKLAQRLRTVLGKKGKLDEYTIEGQTAIFDPPIYFRTDAILSFDDEESLKDLEDFIRTHDIKLVIIDPLYSLGSSEDFFAGMARDMLKLKAIRKKYGVTFVIVHHTKKGTKRVKSVSEIDRENIFGSQLLNGAFEGFIMLNTLLNNQRVILRGGKAFPGEQTPFAINFNIETPNNSITVSPDDPTFDDEMSSEYAIRLAAIEDVNLDEMATKVRDTLTELRSGTKNSIITASKVPRRKGEAALDLLVNMGIVVLDGKNYKMAEGF